jgi:DNA polymerase I-like protein with 3'-5' exonuclease and polymerase domains/5'-3' exonuclease
MYHSYYRCLDKESTIKNADGKIVPRYSAAFETWLESYFDPIIETYGFAPIDIVCCWDGGREYRTQKYPDYKGNRKPFDPVEVGEHDKLIALIQQFLASVGAIQVSVGGVEADDLLAYIAPHVKPFCNVYTVDNDIVQLASETVTVFVKDEEKAEYEGVPAKYIALYKSIIGDSSDHYPGVKGIGPVKFKQLVDAYGWDGMDELEEYVRDKSVGELHDLAEEMRDPVVDVLAHNAAQWKLSYDLAILHPELCYGFNRKTKVEPKWFKRIPNEARLVRTLGKAGIPYLVDKYREHCALEYLLQIDDDAEEIFADIDSNILAYDYETFDPDPQQSLNEANPRGDYVNLLHATPTGASFCFGKNLQYVVYVPVNHKNTRNFLPSMINNVLQRNAARVVHNNAFEKVVTDLKVRDGVESNLCDTVVLSSYVDENRESHHLKDLSKDWLGYSQTTYKELMEQAGVNQTNELSGQEILSYGCDDSLVTAHLWVLFDLISMVEETDGFLYANEFHFTDVMLKGFKRGIPIDQERLAELEAEDTAALEDKFKLLHSTLAEHCIKRNREAVEVYMKEIAPFLRAKARVAAADSELTDEEAFTELYEKEKAKWTALACYTPPTTTVQTETFIPTIKKIEKLLKLAGMAHVGLPTSLAASRVTEWLSEVDISDLGPVERGLLMEIGKGVKHFKTRDPEGLAALSQIYHDLQIESNSAKELQEGDDLNTSSDNQMLSLMYLKLGLPIRHRTQPDRGSFRDTHGLPGAPSASDKALEYALAEDATPGTWQRTALETLREIKTIETRFRYYYRPYPKWIHEDTGRIHPQFRNCGTNSRRPTSTGPNALQVAKGKIRSIFLPMEDDHILVVPDFSGQELRITASESKDPVLLDAFLGEHPKDVHSLTASSFAADMVKRLYPDLAEFIDYDGTKKRMTYECFEEWLKASDPDDSDFRDAAKWIRNKRAKAVNFLTTYMGTAPTLSTNLLIPVAEAQALLDSMFLLYPRLQPFQEEVRELAAKQGYVRSAFGPVRHAQEDLLSSDYGLASRVQRQLVNYLSQGCGADILKKVLRDIAETSLLEETESYVVGPVYDELVTSVPLSKVVEFCPRLQKIMDLTPPGHAVPMVSEFKIGYTWGDLVEIGTDTSEESILKAVEAAKEKVGR